jgi:hypothetical protein
MKSTLLLLILVLLSIGSPASSQQWQLAKSIGGPNNDYISGISSDGNGNIYVVGEFHNEIRLDTISLSNPGRWSIYIAKYNHNGSIVWAKAAVQATDSISDLFSKGIVVDKSGSVVIAGNLLGSANFGDSIHKSIGASDIYLAKYSANGLLQWVRTAGGSGTNNFNQNIANALSIDSMGNYYISGRYVSMAKFDTITITSVQLNEFFIAKYNADGNVVWAKSGGGDGIHTGLGLCSAADGTTYACGQFFGHLTIDGFTLDSGDPEQKMFIAKFTPDGKTEWAKKVGTGGYYGSARDIAIDNSGNTYLTGYYRAGISIGGNDFSYNNNYKYATLVATYDPSGEVKWAMSTGGSDQAGSGNKIGVDSASDIILVGSYSGNTTLGDVTLPHPPGNNTFLAKLSGQGSVIWTKTIDGNGANSGAALSLKRGDIYIAGNYQDTIAFGNIIIKTAGIQDAYVAKLTESTESVDVERPKELAPFYPNPASVVIRSSESRLYVLTDMLGRQVFQCTNCNEIPVENLSNGTYLLNGKIIIVEH